MRYPLVVALGIGAAACGLLGGAVPFTAPQGDLDLDGTVNVVDVQCLVIVYLQLSLDDLETSCVVDADCKQGYYCRLGFTAHPLCLPECLDENVGLGAAQSTSCTHPGQEDADCLGTTAKKNADLNCDGKIGNEDLGFMVAISIGKVGGIGTADVDGDGQLNFCDDDSDADGAPDESDCEPLDAGVGGAGTEICNGEDDDCDGEVDEELAPLTCGLGPCAHSVDACENGVQQDCDPFEGAEVEACNGVDDDCDGEVDEGLGSLTCGSGGCAVEIPACENGEPQQCSGQGQPQTETCDCQDNDCDGQIDEEGAQGCTWYYADQDSDGWGADDNKKCLCQSSWPHTKSSGGDCYDDSWQAKPGQTGWFENHRGDGSFDYNCDGMENYQFDDLFYCNGACNFSTPGWYIMKPQCGQNGAFGTVCLDLMGWLCDIKTVSMKAACH